MTPTGKPGALTLSPLIGSTSSHGDRLEALTGLRVALEPLLNFPESENQCFRPAMLFVRAFAAAIALVTASFSSGGGNIAGRPSAFNHSSRHHPCV
jgi:hypothetical protein